MKKLNEQLAVEVIAGRWGNGQSRKNAIEQAGYDFSAVQAIVNDMLTGEYWNKQSVNTANLYKVEIDLTKYNGLEVTIIK